MKSVKLLVLSLLLASFESHGQILSIDPVFPTSDDTVTIIYDATQGNGALTGVSPVYAHTGLITATSTSPNDWKYVQGNWGTPDPKVLMENLGNNRHKIRYHVRSYYGLPAGEPAQELSFVFRNANGSIVGRDTDGSDIYYPLYDGVALAAAIFSPQPGAIYNPADLVAIEAAASDSSIFSLYLDNVLVSQVYGKSISYTDTGKERAVPPLRVGVKKGGASTTNSFFFLAPPPLVTEALPAGLRDGINYLDDNTVALVQYAPQKSEFVVIGDFNNWEPLPEYYMKRTPDGNRYWLEISGLTPGEEYAYQFIIDGTLRVSDAYATKVLDPWNDPWITSATYPNLKPFPTGKATGVVSVLQTAQTPYVWQNTNFQRPPQTELVIYELLVRDFVAAHDYKTLIDSLDYLQRLGINAIELMPIMEFEGNSSWGYNPSYFFATDKYYGPANDLKAFIDSCHGRGIAVILDMVLNHAFGQCPLVQMYWDAAANKPAANSPWFNPDAKHPFNVGYDFNHESAATKAFVDRVMEYWVMEFQFDGYRMDLSKGFTQFNSGNDVGLWGNYDASRIALLKRMADEVWAQNPDTYIILEHFGGNQEEKELSDYGFMFWGNLVHAYNEATMGFLPNSNFNWISYKQRGWDDAHVVGYMESHDEERLMFKNISFGNSSGPYNTRDVKTALARMEQAATFFFPIPGPKMIWQFGELGYDVSIDFNGRLSEKPIRWYYQLVPERVKLYRVYSALINLRNAHPVFDTDDFQLSLTGAFKRIHLNDAAMNVTVLGNFDVTLATGSPNFQHTGMWYEYFTGDSLNVANTGAALALNPGEYRLYTDVRLSTPDVSLGVEEALADRMSLSLFPNPFSSEVAFTFELEQAAVIGVDILDLAGRTVRQIGGGALPAGTHKLLWDGRNAQGMEVAPGAYFYRLRHDGSIASGKLLYRP